MLFRRVRPVARLCLLLAALALLPMLLAACDGDDDEDNATPGATRAQRTTTARAGTVTAGGTVVGAPTSARQAQVAEAIAVLTAVASGESVPEATIAAARTAIAAATQTPEAVPTEAGTPVPSRTPLPGGEAGLSIDANPGNGAGPCDIIDDSRTVSPGEEFQVAICIESANRPPINGLTSTIVLELSYGTNLTGVARADGSAEGLNGNPDFNEGPALGGSDWDCNLVDDPRGAPQATISPALITCATQDINDNEIATNVALAFVTFTANESGTAALRLGDQTSLLSVVTEVLCVDGSIFCADAEIRVD